MRKFYKLVSENRFNERQTRNRVVREDDSLIDLDTDLREIVESNPAYKKIKSLCEKYNYILGNGYKEKYSSAAKKAFLHMYLYRNQNDYYQPEIYLDRDTQELVIQTTSYGSLDTDTYEIFLEKCENALKLTKEINKLIPDLPTFVIEED